MRQIIAAVAILMAMASYAPADAPLDLAAMAGWDIVLDTNAGPCEAYAAQEFQEFFKQATGQKLPIVKATDRPDRHVFVGRSPSLPADHALREGPPLGPEDLCITIGAGNVSIMGGGPRGVLYGVYTFLEDCLGVRFLTRDHTHVPKLQGPAPLGPFQRVYRPPLGFRQSYYGENAADPAFAVRLRNNSVSGPAKLGGDSDITLINHSLGSYLPVKKYAQEHPEYYASIVGIRLWNIADSWGGKGAQPCLTNPDVLRIITQAILDDQAKHPERRTVSVSQNDNTMYCRCARCRALDRSEESGMGTMLTFVNAVADEVAKQYPGVTVGTLAYKYTRSPPKTIRPRPNVRIQLSSIECCQLHAMDDPACPENAAFCRDMIGWGKICSNICVWSYNTNFRNYLLPQPNLQVLEPNIRFFVANSARGVFEQGAGNATGAEMSELRNYLTSSLLWDPTRSGQKLIDEFLDLHYGQAAPPIRRFLDFTRGHVAATVGHLGHNGSAAAFGIDQAVADEGLKDFAEAMKLADDETVRSRVEKAGICAYRAAIEPIWMENPNKASPKARDDLRPLMREFLRLCGKHGANMAGERMSVGKVAERAKLLYGVKNDAEL